MIDPQKPACWLAKRVLEYGRWSDWQALIANFDKPRLAGIVISLNSLAPRALVFCQAWFELSPTAFRTLP